MELWVSDIINPNKTWNERMLREIFTPTDVAHILQISIPTNGTTDLFLWPHTDDRKVTARSVYHWP